MKISTPAAALRQNVDGDFAEASAAFSARSRSTSACRSSESSTTGAGFSAAFWTVLLAALLGEAASGISFVSAS